MKIPFWVTALIVTAVAVSGWYGQRRISALRSDRDQLAARSAAAGLRIDPADATVRPTKRPRPDRAAAVRRLAADLVADSPKSEAATSSLDDATRQDMANLMDRVQSLGKDPLKLLISELRANWDPTSDADRGKLILFAVTRLSEDAPRDALELLTDSPEMQELAKKNYNGITANPIFAAVQHWAETNPAAALEWVRGHRECSKFSEAELALIFAAAGRDSASALAIIREFGNDPKEIANTFAKRAEPEQRLAFLTVLREWQAQAADGEIPEKCFDSPIRQLVMGGSSQPSNFDFSTRWIEDAKLSPKELEAITQNLNQTMKPGEEEKWIGWLAGKLPEEIALNRISEIAGSWTMKDPKAADTWIANVLTGPVKNTAARAYAEAIFPYNPEEAIRRAMTLPDEEGRKWTLKKFYREWPEDDPAGKAAFAKEHEIE